MGRALCVWLEDEAEKLLPASGAVFTNTVQSGCEVKGSFHASKCRFENHCKQTSLHNMKTIVELVFSDHVSGTKYPDNSTWHLQDVGLFQSNMQVEYLPNTTSLQQPFDQGIIEH
jgi:hypothetical protein